MEEFLTRSLHPLAIVSTAFLTGCVTEGTPLLPEAPVIFEFEENLLEAGAYHGVTFFFQIDLAPSQGARGDIETSDLPDLPAWQEEERGKDGVYYRQLPPIIPEIAQDGREIYRVRDIHRVDYVNSMFETGRYRYLRMTRARLYVFKRHVGDFAFTFRGQRVVVPSEVAWVPSVYYYEEEESPRGDGPVRKHEVVLVGLARIETAPDSGSWHVDGRRFVPDASIPLRLDRAIHSLGTR
jgi:hypothetical protein